jgi:hypothetical protein
VQVRQTDFEYPKHSRHSAKGKGFQVKLSPEALASLRSRLPEYLTKIGVDLRKNGSRLIGKCPAHEDRSPSFAVFGIGHETCGCYPCGFTGDVFAASQWLGRSSSFPDSVTEVAATLGIHFQSSSIEAVKPAFRPAKKIEPPFILSVSDRRKIDAARLSFSDAFDAGEIDDLSSELSLPLASLRWCARGLSGLGWVDGHLAYIYPQGLKLRNPAGLEPRFKWLCGKALAPWRFDWVKPETRTVYLTEGESDCIALVAAGLENDETVACVASPSTSFPREWGKLFKGKRVVICFDHDEAGIKATAKVAEILTGHAAEILKWKGLPCHV